MCVRSLCHAICDNKSPNHRVGPVIGVHWRVNVTHKRYVIGLMSCNRQRNSPPPDTSNEIARPISRHCLQVHHVTASAFAYVDMPERKTKDRYRFHQRHILLTSTEIEFSISFNNVRVSWLSTLPFELRGR